VQRTPAGKSSASMRGGCTRQTGEHRLRPAEWLLGIDHPLGLAQRREEDCGCCSVGECGVVGEECETAGRVRRAGLPSRGISFFSRAAFGCCSGCSSLRSSWRKKHTGEHGHQRLAPENRRSRARDREYWRQRLEAFSLNPGKAGGSPTPGNHDAETGLAGWGDRIRTWECCCSLSWPS
jgi:hypothetical protein